MPTFGGCDRQIVSRFFTLMIATTIFLAGCQDEVAARVAVAGNVVFGTDAQVDGSIRFVPDGGQSGPAAATIVTGGQFRFDAASGPLPGNYRVIFTPGKTATALEVQSAETQAAETQSAETQPIEGKADLMELSAKTFDDLGNRDLPRLQTRVTVTQDSDQMLNLKFPEK